MVRKARVADARAIGDLIDHYARRGMLLPKPLGRIYEALRTFSVWEEKGQVLGCGRLDIVWEDLAEVGSVAVHDSLRGQGVGSALVESLIEEARELGIPRLFALTYQVRFFNRLGFSVIRKHELPQKIWKDCLACSKYDRCDEYAVLRVLDGVPAVHGAGAPTAADFGLSGFTRMPAPAGAHTFDEPPASPPVNCESEAPGQERHRSRQPTLGAGGRLQILP
ncbi:MAG: N-acetyltransferase [Acidobacteria bacterium]|nr:N-acetyltransferase [Acidobacteriota bacterium]